MLVGNDISSAQGVIDFDIYKNNSNFVIMKVSEGVGYQDAKFLRNQSEARRVGLPRGYYHFARPDLGNSPQSEANWFLRTIGNLLTGEILCLDYEPEWNGDAVGWCKGFLDEVFRITGCKPFIYLNKSLVKQYDWKSVVNSGYNLWLACYDNNSILGSWPSLLLQQWTNTQKVPGVTGNVDGDRFFGTLEQFMTLGSHKATSFSVSPSASTSPSVSQSASVSASPSASVSPSASMSPSPSLAPLTDQEKLAYIKTIIESEWSWFGKNWWYYKVNQLRKILYD